MKIVMKVLKGIIEVFNIIAIASLVCMLLLVCANVVMRYIFKNPIPGTYEITQMLMICLSPCMAVTIMAKQCVWVDVVTTRFGRLGQLIMDIVTLPISVVIIGIMAWQGFVMIGTSIEKNTYNNIMSFRMYEWPFRVVFALAMTMAAIAAFCFMIERFAEYRNGGVPADVAAAAEARKREQELKLKEQEEAKHE